MNTLHIVSFTVRCLACSKFSLFIILSLLRFAAAHPGLTMCHYVNIVLNQNHQLRTFSNAPSATQVRCVQVQLVMLKCLINNIYGNALASSDFSLLFYEKALAILSLSSPHNQTGSLPFHQHFSADCIKQIKKRRMPLCALGSKS